MGPRLTRAIAEPGPGPRRGRRPIVAVALAAIACGVAACLVPRRFVVDGLSMGPGLMPGDVVVVPLAGRPPLRRPRRQERWVLLAADGTRMVKRIVGLPGETLRLVAGDVEADGQRSLKSPAELAGCASVVTEVAAGADGRCEWRPPAEGVLDEAAFDPERTRLVEPVADVGLAVVVTADRPLPTAGRGLSIEIGGRRVRFRVRENSPQACVVGRLDGQLVAAAWRATATPRGACLPGGSPGTWDAREPWPTGAAVTRLAVECDEGLRLERVTVWRDVHLVPAANGIGGWQLGPAEYFVVGDHPAGSRDSRHWGPLAEDRLVGRIVTPSRGH